MKQKTKRAIAKLLRVILGPPKPPPVEEAKEIDWQKVLHQFFTQANKPPIIIKSYRVKE